jgi:hypothetical protein
VLGQDYKLGVRLEKVVIEIKMLCWCLALSCSSVNVITFFLDKNIRSIDEVTSFPYAKQFTGAGKKKM